MRAFRPRDRVEDGESAMGSGIKISPAERKRSTRAGWTHFPTKNLGHSKPVRQTGQSVIRGKRRLTRSTTPCNRYTFYPLWSTGEGLFTSRQELAAGEAAAVAAGVRKMPFYGSRSFCRLEREHGAQKNGGGSLCTSLSSFVLIHARNRFALILKRPRAHDGGAK